MGFGRRTHCGRGGWHRGRRPKAAGEGTRGSLGTISGAALVLATRDMPAESRGAAALDGAHHLQLVEADVTAVGRTPSRPVGADNIRELQRWPAHGSGG